MKKEIFSTCSKSKFLAQRIQGRGKIIAKEHGKGTVDTIFSCSSNKCLINRSSPFFGIIDGGYLRIVEFLVFF